MEKPGYLDFELCIDKQGSTYQAAVRCSPGGEARAIFQRPFSDLELENFILRLGMPRQNKVRQISSDEMQLVRQFGKRLFEAVFCNDVRACFISSQNLARHQGLGLRLKLRLEEAPELVNIPWEFLYDPSIGRFLSLFEDTPVVRYIDMREPVAPLAVQPPLSVLVMISNPADYPSLNVAREQSNLREALGELVQQQLLSITWVEKATLPALARSLLRGRYHIFHFIGHGGFDERSRDGVLVMENPQGLGQWVSGERLAVLLGNQPELRLVVLNACEGARTSSDDPFAGAATTLVRTGGVPAVVAMQFAITDTAAITFAHGFYTALSVGRPVDAAVTQARLAIFATGNDVEWGVPVLYMRSPDGTIFNIEQLTPQEREERARAEEARRIAKAAALARRQREREEAERLAEQERQSRLAADYEQARLLVADEDWGAADRLLTQIQEREPAYRDAADLLEQARQGLARQEQLDERYAAGLAALEAGRWAAAIEAFQQALSLAPGLSDASERLSEAQARLEQEQVEARARLEQQERQAQLAREYAAAEEAAKRQDWEAAIESFRAVLALDPAYREAPDRLAQAQAAQAAALKEARAAQAKQEKLEALYLQAVERVKAGDWPQALELLSEIGRIDPEFRDAKQLQEQASLAQLREQQLAALYDQAQAHYERGAWKKAAGLYQELVNQEADYRDASVKLAEAQRQQELSLQFTTGVDHLQAGRWSAAIKAFQGILAAKPAYRHPEHGSAANLLARAKQAKELAEMPPPPTIKPGRPATLPEEIRHNPPEHPPKDH